MFNITRYRLGLFLGLAALVAFPVAYSFASSPTGYEIDPEFQNYYEAAGGLPVFGYAVSEVGEENGRLVQYFERQRLELHPENAGTPYIVLLGHLGLQEAERRGLLAHEAFQPRSSGNGEGRFFEETGHNLSGLFREYWNNHGLDFGDPGVSFRESLALFGYPISEEFVDPDTGLVTQYFERARFEHHPENAGSHYEVLLGHLGNAEVEFLRANGRGPDGNGPQGQRSSSGSNSDDETGSTPAGAVNVRDHGARGNGSADDTDSIKRAIERAQAQGQSQVYLPEGTYMIRAGTYWQPSSTEIELPNGMSLVGAGRDRTTIKVIPNTIENHAHQVGIVMHSNTRVADLTFDGSKDQVNRSGFGTVGFQGIRVQPWDSRNITIENIRVHDIIGINRESFGTMLNGVTGGTLRNIEAHDVEGTGIHIDGDLNQSITRDVRLTGARVWSNTWAGVSVYGARDVVVEDVHAYWNDRGGLNVEWSENVRFQNSVSEDNGLAGFVTHGTNENIDLVGLSLIKNEWSAIRLQENRYHTADPSTGQYAEGITGSMTVRDSRLDPRDGRPEVIVRYRTQEPNGDNIFSFQSAGSDNWSIWYEAE